MSHHAPAGHPHGGGSHGGGDFAAVFVMLIAIAFVLGFAISWASS